MFEFAQPWFLLCLPLAWLVYRFVPERQPEPKAGLYVPFADEFRQDLEPVEASQANGRRMLLWLASLLWLCLILAVARPQWLGEPVEVSHNGRDVMLAVDLSGSMQVQDFILHGQQVDRLTATQSIAGDFIERRQGDRIGLILFGSQAYLQAPLSFDRMTVNMLLQESVIGLAGKKTAIGDAIGLAVKRLKDKQDVSKLVLILLTDGVNTAGALSIEEAVALAKKIGLHIHTIGIGASSIEVASFFGTRTVNPSAELDEAMLQDIATQTGGQYFRAHDSSELENVYAAIDELEPVAMSEQKFRPLNALFVWPLALALLLASLIMIWRART
ncbi:MAG: VWA domain-containing protein [Mariprofundaceae bacterium]